MLTLANLVCGALAIISITSFVPDYKTALLLIILAAVFDFFDGFAARVLNQSSKLGGELDSLSDVVSFGLAPAFIMMSMLDSAPKLIGCTLWIEYGYLLPLIIALFSSLRLAKFNIDEEQSCEFIGLPTPACALMCGALGLIYSDGYVMSSELIAAASIVLALLLISPFRMFALKFKGFAIKGNEVRYGFMIISALLFAILSLKSFALIILLYIILSIILHYTCRKGIK